jgi:GNAT superfamily N-acetyltransferase
LSGAHWIEAAIGKSHDRKAFDCGDAALNDYLVRFARQNHDSGGAKTFLACDPANRDRILGFYTLSPASIDYARTPSLVRRKLGKYEVPAFRLGRLAVDQTCQGVGLGGQLLIAAGARCIAAAELVGGVALVIDAKSPRAAAWYAGFGAIALDDAPLTLMLPLATLANASTPKP